VTVVERNKRSLQKHNSPAKVSRAGEDRSTGGYRLSRWNGSSSSSSWSWCRCGSWDESIAPECENATDRELIGIPLGGSGRCRNRAGSEAAGSLVGSTI